MERIYIKILESFPLISKVMPYYAWTHRMFLLLSEVSKKTRLILIKNYTLFRRIMLEYSMEKSIDIKKLLMLNIPYDLFKFNIKNSNVNSVEYIIDLANTME